MRNSPRIGRQPSVLEVHDLLGHAVEKPPVVGHDEISALALREVFLEKLHGREIEVVRRLVQQQHVRRGQDRPGQHRPVLLASRQLRKGPAELLLFEAEAGEGLLDLRHHVVAAFVLEAVGQRVVAVVCRRRGVSVSHGVLEPAHLRLDPVQVLEGASDEVVEGLAQVRRGHLIHRADADRVGPHDFTRSGSSVPSTRRNRVVLPAPLRPIRPTFSPGLCCQVASRSTSFGP